MPLPATQRRLEELKANQRRRGVTEPLVGMDTEARKHHASDIKYARKHLTSPIIQTNGGLIAIAYHALGDHYQYQMPESFPRFAGFIRRQLKQAESNEKIRWLDIGPGIVRNFMPYFKEIDPSGALIDLHTLSPEQILPRKKYKQPNPDFQKWNERLTHHVGTIETYDPKKLGKFHVIVSIVGGTGYTRQPIETTAKVANMLHTGGKAFISLEGTGIPRERLKTIQKTLGENFEVKTSSYLAHLASQALSKIHMRESQRSNYGKYLTITRKT
ncbi:MAG: class I SAM-dependent methyltransferase [Candidatus Micrarchaeota archaeon]